jgi:hypothetical protein
MNYWLLVPMLAGRGGCPPGYSNNECVGGEGNILVTIELCLMVCTQLWLRLSSGRKPIIDPKVDFT